MGFKEPSIYVFDEAHQEPIWYFSEMSLFDLGTAEDLVWSHMKIMHYVSISQPLGAHAGFTEHGCNE